MQVDGHGKIVGDIAWGGNWFFLVRDHGQKLELANVEVLTDYTWRIRQGLERARITGEGGHAIDHVELFAAAHDPGNDSRNFVMCPGQGVRPLTLRHRPEREARVPARRGEAGAR